MSHRYGTGRRRARFTRPGDRRRRAARGDRLTRYAPVASAILVVCLSLSCASRGTPLSSPGDAPVASPIPSSAGAGVYLAEDAQRGEATYRRNCTYCHGVFLDGDDADGPPLTGIRFLNQWNGRTVAALTTKVAQTMPLGLAGTLSATEYRDIVSYILQENGMPPGDAPLPSEPAGLERIVISRRTTPP